VAACYTAGMRRRASWLLLSLAWAMACGGRYQSSDDDDDAGRGATGQGGGSATTGGTTGRAGTGTSAGGKISGTAGTVSVGTGGATTMGGAPAVGGFATAGTCACDPIACAPGYKPVPDPGGCCFHCEQDVMGCAQAQADYRRLRQEMLDKYRSDGCATDNDCTVYYTKNACDVNGCPVVLPVRTVMSFVSNLEGFAQMSCTGCPTEPRLPCEAVPPMLCRMGRCQ
jgi:hypothetical protein